MGLGYFRAKPKDKLQSHLWKYCAWVSWLCCRFSLHLQLSFL